MVLLYEIPKTETIRHTTRLKYYHSVINIVLYLCINECRKSTLNVYVYFYIRILLILFYINVI